MAPDMCKITFQHIHITTCMLMAVRKVHSLNTLGIQPDCGISRKFASEMQRKNNI